MKGNYKKALNYKKTLIVSIITAITILFALGVYSIVVDVICKIH